MIEMTKYWNARLRAMQAYTPGFQPQLSASTIKLNTNENPWPPSPLALKAMSEAIGCGLRLYPPSDWADLRQAISEGYGFGIETIFCGNGSDEVLTLIFRCFTDPGDTVLLPYPTYSLYPVLAASAGCKVEYVDTNDDFTINFSALAKKNGRMVILANPNAPTGILVSPKELYKFAESFPGLVVIDEAYIDFSPEGSSCLKGLETRENMIILRTFSKSFSLCGIRCGYAFAAPGLVKGLMAMKDSYNLDLLAQVGAAAAIRDLEWMQDNAQRIIATREQTTQRLLAMGFTVLPSAANFVFVRHKTMPAKNLYQRLTAEDIHVRHFAERRVSDWLRISIGTDEEMDRVFSVLTGILGQA
jgi:histidinol-phosphate aminotransferase